MTVPDCSAGTCTHATSCPGRAVVALDLVIQLGHAVRRREQDVVPAGLRVPDQIRIGHRIQHREIGERSIHLSAVDCDRLPKAP